MNYCKTYSKKRKIVPDRDQSHYRQPSPEKEAGPSNVQKRAKSDVHVLVSPLSAGKKSAGTRAPFSTHEGGPNGRAGSSRATTTKRERDDLIRPLPRRSVVRAKHKMQQPRSPSPEVSCLDPPIPSRITNTTRTRPPVPAQSSSSVRHSSSLLAGLRNGNGNTAQSQGPPRTLRPLPRRSAHLRSVISAQANAAPTRTNVNAVDRLCNIPSFDVKLSNKFLLDKTANRAQLSAVLGGTAKRTCVSTDDYNLIYPCQEFQPWCPSTPGKPGLFLHPSPEEQWKGDIHTLFVAQYKTKYRYVGEYKLEAAEPLSPDEFNALPSGVSDRPRL